MGIFDRLLGPAKKGSSGLFNQASQHWQVMKEAVLKGDDAEAQSAFLEVVRLCQEAIELSPKKEGDAYVLLTNALLRASQIYNGADDEILMKYAAACIRSWWILPRRNSPITSSNNYELGFRWYQEVLSHLEETGQVNAESAMAEYASSYGKLITSPAGLNYITRALSPSTRHPDVQQGNADEGDDDTREFLEAVAVTIMRSILERDEDGALVVETKRAGNLVGMAFTIGFVLARQYGERIQRMFLQENASDADWVAAAEEPLSDILQIANTAFDAQKTGRSLTAAVLASALSGLSQFKDVSVIPADVAFPQIEKSCEYGARLGLFVPQDYPNIEEECHDEMSRFGLPGPNDDSIQKTAQWLIEKYQDTIKFVGAGTPQQVTKAAILEEMCHLPGLPAKQIQAAGRLAESEATLLTKKFLLGNRVFPITPTATEEGINRWLKEPFTRTLFTSMAVDTSTIESLLRKLLQEEYDNFFEKAKEQVAARKYS